MHSPVSLIKRAGDAPLADSSTSDDYELVLSQELGLRSEMIARVPMEGRGEGAVSGCLLSRRGRSFRKHGAVAHLGHASERTGRVREGGERESWRAEASILREGCEAGEKGLPPLSRLL